MDEATKRFASLSQAEAGYTPVSTVEGKACANCRWFRNAYDDFGDACQIVDDYPESIVSNGYCNRHEAAPALEPEPLPVYEVEIDEPLSEGEMSILKKAWHKLFPQKDDGFAVFKGTDERRYWVAKYTNNFKDRDNEYFTDAAHDEYVKLVNEGVYPMPELWTYHRRQTRHGVAEHVWKSGSFVFALGVFDDTPEAKHAYAFYTQHSGKIKLSHGFYYPSSAKKEGVYHKYRTFEISTLPAGTEANPYTDFQELETMALSEQVRKWIANVGGESMLQRVESMDKAAVQQTDALKGQGVDYKGLGLPTDDEAFKALRADYDKLAVKVAELQAELTTAQQTAQETESSAKQLVALLQPLVSLQEGNEATQKALTAVLEKQAELDKRWAEFSDLQAPATKSDDALLSKRELSFLDRVVTESKAADGGQSFLDQVTGQTTISES